MHPRTTYNSLTPISRLMPETLCAIFSHATDTPGGRNSDAHIAAVAALHCAIHISHVCKYWRDVALGYPYLWNTLRLQDMVPQHIMESLKRSQKVPLTISWDIPRADDIRQGHQVLALDDKDSRLVSILREQLQRVRVLSLWLEHGKGSAILEQLDVPAPLLQSLTIRGNMLTQYSSKAYENILQLLRHSASRTLRQLRLFYLPVQWPHVTLSHLTRLIIRGRPSSYNNPPDVKSLLAAIARMPLLKHLAIIATLGDYPVIPSTDSKRTSLPNLGSLCVTERESNCMQILNKLAVPSLRHLDIDIPGIEDTVSDIAFLTSTLTEKAAALGSFGTVFVDLASGSDTTGVCITAYSAILDIAAVHKLALSQTDRDQTYRPTLRVNIGVRGARGSQVDVITSKICQPLPLDNVRTLVVGGSTMLGNTWMVLAQKAHNTESLMVSDMNGMEDLLPDLLHPSFTLTQRICEDNGSHEQPSFPRLRQLSLVNCNFSGLQVVGPENDIQADTGETLATRLLGCFAARAEQGIGIQKLCIAGAHNLVNEDVELLRVSVEDLEWDGMINDWITGFRILEHNMSNLNVG